MHLMDLLEDPAAISVLATALDGSDVYIEPFDGCIHDFNGVGALPEDLAVIEQCSRCKKYRSLRTDDVQWIDDEDGADE